MRTETTIRRSWKLVITTSLILLPGCGSSNQSAEGPEMGSIEAYLEANPEEREEDPNEAGSEEEAFDAAS